MKNSTAQLTAAVAELAKVSKEIRENNEKLKQSTLDYTVNAISLTHEVLAKNKTLQAALIAAIKDQLAKDPDFLGELRKAIQTK